MPRPVRRPAPTVHDAELAAARRQLCTANGRISTLEEQLDALATVTANLYHENLALKTQARVRRQGQVTALPAPCQRTE
ncbi:hypothetical protein [Streptomyces himalayensis]|uniref:Transposase n=1 Tax=Streptomyces himalayensis subsp. himalayensis TaxID=2756131 RepID=A0A7W0I8Z7_9ACTN|nr:hypothetical protein [Streptomyces himalayensis]MBA2946835.1 hypothetical protein [Streptomyces himalayensis subsp. himalayensis]